MNRTMRSKIMTLILAMCGLLLFAFLKRSQSNELIRSEKNLVQEFGMPGANKGNFLLKPNGRVESLENKDKRHSQDKTWCKSHERFPNGTRCFPNEKASRIKEHLVPPHPYQESKKASTRYSQAKQDEVVYDIIQKDGGFFLEIGANDGQLFSNSLWLERKHHWTGLLIEADPGLCAKIDQLKRHAWRMCACLSKTMESVSYIMGGALGGVESNIDEHHLKTLNKTNRITVPCFGLEDVLDVIKSNHIDFFSLDVEGAEMSILESLREGLVSKWFTVDVWSIEYRVWDGQRVVLENSLANLNALRNYFKGIGGYKEHSQLSNDGNFKDGYALDVVFVREEMFCKKHDTWPNGDTCN